MKKIFIPLFLSLGLSLILTSCGKQEKKATNNGIDESAVAVKLSPVEQGDYSLPIISSGLMSTETESRLSFKVSGMITKIYVKEGDNVSKGQLLASLDLTEIDAQVSQSKNNLEKSKRDLERGQRLLKDSAATLEQIQNLQTAYNVANEAYNISSFNRQFSTIRANTSGKVIRKFVNDGEQVSAGAPVLTINSAANNDWLVKIGLPDVDWVRVKKGDHAIVTTDAYPGIPLDGVLDVINEGSDAVSGLYQAEVKINPGSKKLASGLFAKVEIIPSEKRKLFTIPVEAVIEGQGKKAFVFVANDDKKTVKKIVVEIAYLQSNNKVYITKGLENTKEVITSGSAFLTENSTIKIENQ